MIFSERNMRT